jgi:hypothetical protein
MKRLSPSSLPGDVSVGIVFLASVGLITVAMLTMVVLFSMNILV